MTSLKWGMKHLNMIIPERFFINPPTDRPEVRVDEKALREMRSTGIPVMPMLTNNYNGEFNPGSSDKSCDFIIMQIEKS